MKKVNFSQNDSHLKLFNNHVHHNINKPQDADEVFMSRISPELRVKLVDIYKRDFEMFGYDYKSYLP